MSDKELEQVAGGIFEFQVNDQRIKPQQQTAQDNAEFVTVI